MARWVPLVPLVSSPGSKKKLKLIFEMTSEFNIQIINSLLHSQAWRLTKSRKKKDKINSIYFCNQLSVGYITKTQKKNKIGRRNSIVSSIPETRSHLEIREPGSSSSSASYVLWKTWWGGNIDKTGKTHICIFFFLFFEWVFGFGLRASFSRVLIFVRPWQDLLWRLL